MGKKKHGKHRGKRARAAGGAAAEVEAELAEDGAASIAAAEDERGDRPGGDERGKRRPRQGMRGGEPVVAGVAKAGPTAVVEREDRFEVYAPGTLRLDAVDLTSHVERDGYGERLLELQRKAYQLQIENYLQGRRAVAVFEGWDAAGKGGCIKRLTALMDPRGLKVWPIAAPRDEEARQHYLWRFWERLPEKGEIAIFDRSWYGRVLVERVEGFASEQAWRRGYDEINAFERMLTADGVRIVKFWLHIDRETQLRRFEARETDPLKKYKLSSEDWRNRKKWKDYAQAVQDVFDRTHRPDAPWVVVPANDKKTARLLVLETCVNLLTP